MNIYKWTSDWSHSESVALCALEKTTSTNDLAKREAFQRTEDTLLYLADHQEQGRGRYDRNWVDQGKGQFLLSSWSFAVSKSPHPVISARIGLSLIESFAATFKDHQWSLKAPNDILLNGKKVCGILTEAVSQGDKHRLIIGVGINVLASPDIENASNLRAEGVSFSQSLWKDFMTNILTGFKKLTSNPHVSELSSTEQTGLMKWLNENINLKDPYTSVGKDGSLDSHDQTIPWEKI